MLCNNVGLGVWQLLLQRFASFLDDPEGVVTFSDKLPHVKCQSGEGLSFRSLAAISA